MGPARARDRARLEAVLDGAHALGVLGMAFARIMIEALVRVQDERLLARP